MPAALLFALVLALPPQDAAEESYRYLAGLHDKGLHELVIDEARAFLERHPRHERAALARYRLAASLFELGRLEEAAPEFRRLAQARGFELRDESALRLGQCALELGRLEEAQAALELALESGGDSGAGAGPLRAPATLLLGELAFRRGEHAAAEARYAEALALAPEGEHAALAERGRAWCALELGRHAEAVERARAFVATRPEHELTGELRLVEGEALLAAGDARAALEALRPIQEGPFLDAALRGRGFARSALGEHDAAAAAFGELLRRAPQGPFAAEAALQQGAHLVRAGRPREALAPLAAGPETAERLYWRARAESESGDAERALASVDAALAMDAPAELAARLLALRGDLAFELGRLDEAARVYERAGSDYALHAGAVAHWNAGRPEEAARLARELLERFPESELRGPAQLALGEALYALARYDEAAAQLAPLAADARQPAALRARALSRVAWCRYSAGAPAEAAALFGGLLERHPEAPEAEEARFLRARALEEAGEPEAARRAYAEALERHPDSERRGDALLRLGRLESGRDSLERLVALEPDGPLLDQALSELARKDEASGDAAAAAARYAELLERRPDSPLAPDARYARAYCLRACGDAPGAVQELEALLEGAPEGELELAALELLVWSAADAGRIERCVSAWRDFGAKCRDNARAFPAARAAARALEAGARPVEAQHLFERFLAADVAPELRLAARVERGWLALGAGDPEAGQRELGDALRVERSAGVDASAAQELAFFLGEAFFERGEHPRAAELYSLAAGSPTLAVEATYKQGFAELLAGQDLAAAESFGQVVAAGPANELFGEGLYLEGEALFRAGRHEAACAPLERLLAEVPRHETRPKALFRLGQARLELGDARRAAELLGALAREHADFEALAEAELGRGRALDALGDARGARAAFERVLELDKGVLSARARLALGGLCESDGALDEALSHFLKVSLLYAHEAEVAEALYRAGRVLEAQGEPALARRQYEECAAQHAGSAFAAEARARLRGL